MKAEEWLRMAVRNLLLLLLVALPLLPLVLAAVNRSRSSDALGDATILYVGFLGPLTLGGLLYLATAALAAERWPGRARAAALALTPVLASGWVVTGEASIFTLPGFLIAFTVSALVYGALVKLLPSPRSNAGSDKADRSASVRVGDVTP